RRPVAGAGAGWYVAADLDSLSRAALLRLVCAHARVRPVVADLPDGVEAQRRGKVLFLLNHGDRAAEVVGVMGTDLLTGDACTGHVVLSPRSALAVRDNMR
ncbi:Beta-galactosidase C-terminal domain, partial [Actinomyces sp. oral taxon 171]|uniref:Beta-galactosidase C-terminal domain n=1 Tax=Actinomyces sp. oral taxon 171 TaxID=706438 RepID=UPI0001F62171